MQRQACFKWADRIHIDLCLEQGIPFLKQLSGIAGSYDGFICSFEKNTMLFSIEVGHIVTTILYFYYGSNDINQY